MISTQTIKAHLKDIESVQVNLHGQYLDFQMWPANKLDEWNKEYNVEEIMPGYFAIGTDGGSEMLTIEISTGKVYSIPFIPMDINEREEVSTSIYDLVIKD